MALITLKDIGKIYTSEGSVAVGIRGVNLSFERGEFVAVTGRSGSGKSTLLNVISGMDTYEEGEMLVEGEPTSHYLQDDWEEYREKYISFIFQDYNIIESFTVLQNVELALMYIDDRRERRKRAVELLGRVGMEKHLHHKGSKLSGGQKQRTVIARALAKDSPIILADEPTGNLDSKTSEEIIELLREVSRDKLVIVVTHNFEQVSHCATRHIRVFDGAIESDHVLSENVCAPEGKTQEARGDMPPLTETGASARLKRTFFGGLTLGKARFRAMPKLSAFVCILMVISTLAVTLMTSIYSDAISGMFEKNYIFTHIDGRLVIVRQDGNVITDAELSELVEKTGAKSYAHYDYLLDARSDGRGEYMLIDNEVYRFDYTFDDFDGIDEGRAPQRADEVLLSVPISFKTHLDGGRFSEFTLEDVFGMVDYTVVGVRYYYDNTRYPEMIFTQAGYETAAAICYFANSSGTFSASFELSGEDGGKLYDEMTVKGSEMLISFRLSEGTYYICAQEFAESVKELEKDGVEHTLSGTVFGSFTSYKWEGNYTFGYIEDTVYYEKYGSVNTVERSLDGYTPLLEADGDLTLRAETSGDKLVLSPDIIKSFVYGEYFSSAYTQASLFYRSDAEAEVKAKELREMGYIAAPSSSVMPEEEFDILMRYIACIFPFIGWILSIVFITVFLTLCTSKAMRATKGDVAILRSMGIPAKTIKVSIYVQNVIAVLPAYLLTAAACTVIFTVPRTNSIFTFLRAPHYVIIALSVLAVALLLSRRQAKNMFGDSVKKTLRADR